jgi:K+-sensing histidine kinase KdpD
LNARERASIKWLIVGWCIFIPIVVLFGLVVPTLAAADSLALLVANFAGFFGCGINIAGCLMAVLYANAFDIDVFVRRTLVYTLLTAILTLFYAGLVIGARMVFSAFGPEEVQSPLILVGSTLAIAALFQPLRRRLQQMIDRRFYRRRYDATQTLAAFSAAMRQEVDVDQLREQLVAVVQETMQPSHVSLWLQPTTPNRNPQATRSPFPPGSSCESESR